MTDSDAATVTANDVVAFLVELLAIALLSWYGVHLGGTPLAKALLGIALPLLAIVLWALFAAPTARFGSPVVTLLVKLLVLGSAAAAGFVLLPIAWAIGFAVVTAANLVLIYVGPFAR